jgi:hypothetical protein
MSKPRLKMGTLAYRSVPGGAHAFMAVSLSTDVDSVPCSPCWARSKAEYQRPEQPPGAFRDTNGCTTFSNFAARARRSDKENIMTDEVKKNEGQTPDQLGQQKQKNPQDAAKQPNSSQDRTKELEEKQNQPEQGGQRRAS